MCLRKEAEELSGKGFPMYQEAFGEVRTSSYKISTLKLLLFNFFSFSLSPFPSFVNASFRYTFCKPFFEPRSTRSRKQPTTLYAPEVVPGTRSSLGR